MTEPTISADVLAELERLEKSMTPGEWRAFITAHTIAIQHDGKPDIVLWTGFDDSDRPWGEHAANAQGIAAARNALRSLLATARRYAELLAGIEGAVKELFSEASKIDRGIDDDDFDGDLDEAELECSVIRACAHKFQELIKEQPHG